MPTHSSHLVHLLRLPPNHFLPLLHFLTNYVDPTLVPDAPPSSLPDIPLSMYTRRLWLPRPATGMWSTCVRPWWETHYFSILTALYANGARYHPLDVELWLGVNSGAHYFDADDNYLQRCDKRVSATLRHLLDYTSATVEDPSLLGALHDKLCLLFWEFRDLLVDLIAIRRYFWPQPFVLLDYPLRGLSCLPLYHPYGGYMDGNAVIPYYHRNLRFMLGWDYGINTYTDADDDYGDDHVHDIAADTIVPSLLHHQLQLVSEETRPRDPPPPPSTIHEEKVSSTLLRFLANYQDPRLVPDTPPPPLLPDLPSPLPPLLQFEPPASCVWSTCVRPWWEKHIAHILVYIYEDGYKYHPLVMELWLGINSGAICYDADEDFHYRSGGRVTEILLHLVTYVPTIFPPCVLDEVHGRMRSFFEEVYALLNDLTAIRRHFWPLPFALLDYPLRGENLLPLNCPPNYQDAYRTVPTKMRDAFALEPRMNTYSADDDDYDDDASSWGTRSDGSDSSTHSYCSDDDWEECSSGADSFADHSSTDVPENPSGTHRLPGPSDTCTTSNIHALVTAPATVVTHTDKNALVTVFPRSQQTPCKHLIKAYQYIALIEKDLFSDCNNATAPTSISIPPPRPSSTHHYSRADELLMSARMISLHRHNIQMRTLTMLDQLTLPLYLHNSTYHPSLTPQAVIEIRPCHIPLYASNHHLNLFAPPLTLVMFRSLHLLPLINAPSSPSTHCSLAIPCHATPRVA